MADYHATHWVRLNTPVRSGNSSLSWSGTLDVAQSLTVVDTAPTGEMNQTDKFATGTFSGFYLNIEGRLYGVFLVSTNYVVPYIKTDHDIIGSAALNARVTTAYATNLSNAANCFLGGTRLATPQGERAIETLAPGDLVLGADGTAHAVLWVWRQDIPNIPGPTGLPRPVTVATDALGPGCPARDLTVSADHGICLEGYVVNAAALVNGSTIRKTPAGSLPPVFTYWHVETATHCALLAEGCPAESFLDYGARGLHADHAAYLARHGRDRPIAEMPLPRITSARQLPTALRNRLGIDRVA